MATVLPAGAAEHEAAESGNGLVAAVGGFSDVGEGSVHASAVEALASEGVFDDTECGPGLFCPGDPILRWEMAVWLVRVLDGGAEPEAVGSSRFADVDAGVWWAPYVERFAELEVTRGCDTDPLRYCPEEAVTRAQMASFLVRAFGLLPGPPAGFSDVSASGTHFDNINALAYSRVTKGCAEGMFCPSKHTTRAQMASFLVRARSVEERPVSVMVPEIDVVAVVEASGGSGFGDPYDPVLPGVADASETVAWLQGEGQPVAGLVAEAAGLWVGHQPDCAAVAGRLDELGTPSELREAALRVPDPVTAELLIAAHLGVVEMLRSCGDTQTSSEQAWQWVVAHRRLVELGVIGECSEPGCGGLVAGLGEGPAAASAEVEPRVVGWAPSDTLDLPPDLTVAVSKPVASLFLAPALSPVLATNYSKTVSWQSAGDSYSAGQGLRDREGICARSPRAYGPTAADLLGDRGWIVSSETYVACSGAVIEQYFNGWEVPWGPSYFERVGICAGNPLCAVALPGGTSSIASQWEQSRDQGGPGRVDVMTLSFGGNDIGFADVLSDCVTLPNKWDVVSGCDIAEWELKSRISNLLNPPRSCAGRGPRYELGGADRYECDLDLGDERGSIVDFYVKVVEEKLTDRGQLYVVGYPKLFAPVNEWPGWIKTSCQAVLRGDTEKLGRVAEHLNVHLRSAVTRANERLGGAPRVHYIDLLEMYRDNQAELCGTKADWLHGLFAPPVTTCCSYHPNVQGYKKTAERLAAVVMRHTEPPASTSPIEAPEGTFRAVSAGGHVTCGLRTNGTIQCWGQNINDQATPPAGTYTAITNGGEHGCAIGTDGTTVCWGSNQHTQSDPPPKRLRAVEAGGNFTCGLDHRGTVDCWGGDTYGETQNEPQGTHTAIAAGLFHACALSTDRTINCWGFNGSGQASPPPGTYTAVSAGFLHSCAMRTDQTVTCWGRDDSYWGQDTPPTGTYTAIEASDNHTCAIHTSGRIHCWGDNTAWQATPPPGSHTAIASGHTHSCALRTDATIACWGNNQPPAQDATHFLSSSHGHSCAIRTDQTIACWGNNGAGQTDAPAGTYTAVSTGGGHSCALRTDRTITCWGDTNWGATNAPAGTFTALSAGTYHACAIRTDETITCWGENVGGLATPPAGTFTAIDAGDQYNCAIRSDQTIACWGLDHWGRSDAPPGAFSAVSAGGPFTCAIRGDQTIACWGTDLLEDIPTDSNETFTAISNGGSYLCAIRTDQTIGCWGHENIVLGATPPTGSFIAISVGGQYVCAIRAIRISQTIACWGTNHSGQSDPPKGNFGPSR